MIYLRAGLYAEGPSDYAFLLRLLDRLLEAIAAAMYPGAYEIGETIGIDAPPHLRKAKRADRIAAAAVEYAELFELLVIHGDGDADPKVARAQRIEPGMAAIDGRGLPHSLALVACVPVRETEAWMLTDVQAFRDLLGSRVSPELPGNPEGETDPKATLQAILKQSGGRRLPASLHAFFGERVDLKSLRRLPAFRAFEAELTAAVRAVARVQGQV